MEIIPRIIRLRDAPNYLGMNKNHFNSNVRPCLTEIPIGDKGVGFDRLELDEWVAYTKNSSGRPARRRILWDAKDVQSLDYDLETESGTYKKQSKERMFAKLLEQATKKKLRSI